MLFSEKTEGAWREGGEGESWRGRSEEENTKGKREGVRKGRKERG